MSNEERQPMTVEQAVERLAQIVEHSSRRDRTLCVPYDPGHATMGGTPVKPVLGIHSGFDWDSSKVLIDVGPRLLAPGPDQEKLKENLAKAHETLGWIGVALRSGLPAAGVLKAVKSHYEKWMEHPERAPRKEKP